MGKSAGGGSLVELGSENVVPFVLRYGNAAFWFGTKTIMARAHIREANLSQTAKQEAPTRKKKTR